MANRIGNSVSLMRASFNVLKLDKELMLFPIMSGIASVLVMASFIVPVVFTGAWEVLEATSGGYVELSIIFAVYVLLYTVTFYFNAALVGAAAAAMATGCQSRTELAATIALHQAALVLAVLLRASWFRWIVEQLGAQR